MERDAYDDIGRHAERECRIYRDEAARREGIYTAMGCGREYRRLMTSQGRPVLPDGKKALPLRKQLSAVDSSKKEEGKWRSFSKCSPANRLCPAA